MNPLARVAVLGLLMLSASTLRAESAPGETAPPDSAAPDGGAAAAAPEATDKDKAAAKAAVQEYLTAVKAKKWDNVRKLTHPVTIVRIADIKKRKRVEDDEMAPWAKEKESWLNEFKLGEPMPSAKGAIAVPSTEQIYSVEDNGVEDGVKVEYLVIPVAGKWWVTDRRIGENEFPASTLAASYKGYFEGEFTPPPPQAPEKKTRKSKKKGAD
jgi:hypothetical protein